MSGTFEVDPTDDDMEMLAAEYALGLLTVAQLPHVAALRQGSARFDQAVHRWEVRLLPLAEAIEPVEPPARIWPAIATAIAPGRVRAGVWDSLRFWRGFGVGAGLLGAGLAAAMVVVVVTRAPQMPVVATATLASQHEGIFVATAQQASGGIKLMVSPAQVSVPADKSAELWLITPGNKPVPLGLLASSHPVSVTVPASQLAGNISLAELAVSIEPLGGSPTGQPTGPVISAAKFEPL